MFAFTMVIVRGNPVSQLWIALQCYLVLYVVDKILLRLYGTAENAAAKRKLIFPAEKRAVHVEPAPRSGKN
jgi:hypothetical protein